MRIALVGYGKVGQAIHRAIRKDALHKQYLELVAVVDKRFGRGLEPPTDVPHVFAEDRRTHLPWREMRPDLVIDATGAATTRELAAEHLASGAPRVVVTQPMPDADATLVAGVNAWDFDPLKHLIISASSCTAACFAPLGFYLNLEFGIEEANFMILHGYDAGNIESDIMLNRVDPGAVEKLKRGERVPFRTNFARNVRAVMPDLGEKLSAEAFYQDDGILTADRGLFIKGEFRFKKPATSWEVNAYLEWAAGANLAGIVTFFPALCRPAATIQSASSSTVFFSLLTLAEGDKITLFFGGDYIYGYAKQVFRLAALMGEKLKRGGVVTV